MAGMRHFGTGATRDQDTSKNDYEGFLSPLVIEAFGDYMNTNRIQPDGSVRASDNWQLGIPKEAYMKSLWRHFLDVWKWHRGYSIGEHMIGGVRRKPTRDELFAGILFNTMGYWHELLRADDEKKQITDFNVQMNDTLQQLTSLRLLPAEPCKVCSCPPETCGGKSC